MNISILTVCEQLYEPFVHTSLVGKAQEKGIVQIDVQSFFSYVQPKARIDAPTFGPGAGMLIRPDVVQKAIEAQEAQHGKAFKIFFSPRGQKVDQRVLETIAARAQEHKHLMLIPARYEGMDARVEEEYADMILSMGDFVIMGGDLPAMIVVEGVLRLLPQVVGNTESVARDSFSGPFVDFPSYTEPVEWQDKRVPDILRSGNHAAIETWRQEHAVAATVKEHFTWLRSQKLTKEEKALASTYIPPHYVALMHTDVLIGDEKRVGNSSVTSVDIHDIARSSKTYGIKEFFIVTPLVDQQKIVQKMLDFWKKGIGFEYNRCRYDAIQLVQLMASLQDAVKRVEELEGKKPLIITTSAKEVPTEQIISFYDQTKVWATDRPVLLLFGTGQGLAPFVIEQSDYLLVPVEGFSDFNHLSVRSAVAIILDRWLGVNLSKT
ncbi:MAG TPA: RNA methyltransferase, partial [Candidatus Babeliales bacterium]|jgi:tRNA (guanine37-N1)-methyltransferase|nr:RNA methyltransferase [Candidatus Babeliales bacterium]